MLGQRLAGRSKEILAPGMKCFIAEGGASHLQFRLKFQLTWIKFVLFWSELMMLVSQWPCGWMPNGAQ
jgi:hypothetical protein